MGKQGRELKTIAPFNRIIPYVMRNRTDSQVFARETIPMRPLEDYLISIENQTHNINYLHIFLATYVRVIALRPALNRYILNSKVFARNRISIAMAVKRRLTDEGEETTVKFEFTGKENIFEVAEIVQKAIEEGIKDEDEEDSVDGVVNKIMKLPGIIKKAMVGILLFLDRRGWLPKAVIKVSPFHSTMFLSYLKSIKMPYVYHHLYNLGTTSLFVAIGQTTTLPISINGTPESRRVVEIGYTVDERICDGFYLGASFKLARKYLNNPKLLEEPLDSIIEDVE